MTLLYSGIKIFFKGVRMITLEQLDELESRIVRALELIGDLRTENSRLESENQKLREEHDQLKNALEQKERDVQVLKDQLEKANQELNELKQKESMLEKRITDILSKLANAEGSNYVTGDVKKSVSSSFASSQTVISQPTISNDELTIVEEDIAVPQKEDESSVEIEIEKPLEKPVVQGKEEEHGFVKQSAVQEELEKSSVVVEEEEIIVLDEDEDEIILAEDADEEVILEDQEEISDIKSDLSEAKKLEENKLQEPVAPQEEKKLSMDDDIILDDDIGVFELEDDDFLIIEENENNNK